MCTASSAYTGIPGRQQAPHDVRTSEGQAERPAHHPDILTMAPQGPQRITPQAVSWKGCVNFGLALAEEYCELQSVLKTNPCWLLMWISHLVLSGKVPHQFCAHRKLLSHTFCKNCKLLHPLIRRCNGSTAILGYLCKFYKSRLV
jgi:hypothetical protein